MTVAISRAQFLRGDISGKRKPLRPPWAIDELHFINACNSCGDCVRHCPEGILEQGRGSYPLVNFNNGECTFCGNCLEQCDKGALRETSPLHPWNLKAHIEDACLAKRGVMCVTCGEQCETRAITFQAAIGSVSQPLIDMDTCNGCGACYAPCPVDAIAIREEAIT